MPSACHDCKEVPELQDLIPQDDSPRVFRWECACAPRVIWAGTPELAGKYWANGQAYGSSPAEPIQPTPEAALLNAFTLVARALEDLDTPNRLRVIRAVCALFGTVEDV